MAATTAGAKACTWATSSALTCAGDKLVIWLVVSVVPTVAVVPALALVPDAVLSALTAAVVLPATLEGLLGFAGKFSALSCAVDKLANWLLLKAATCSADKLLNWLVLNAPT